MLNEETALKIEKVIKESLPSQVGEMLRKELDRIPKLEQEYQDAIKENNSLHDQLKELKSIAERLQRELSEHRALDKRLKDIQETEIHFEVERLKYEIQAEKDKTEFAKSVALGLVRNTEYRRTLFDSKSGPEGRDQYGQTLYATHTQNSTEENKAE